MVVPNHFGTLGKAIACRNDCFRSLVGKSAMTRDHLVMWLYTEAKRIGHLAPDAVWYLFGSAIHTFENARDIDVLVLCDSHEAVALIRHELGAACMRLPLHLILVTRNEESELGFLVQKECLQIYPCNPIDDDAS